MTIKIDDPCYDICKVIEALQSLQDHPLLKEDNGIGGVVYLCIERLRAVDDCLLNGPSGVIGGEQEGGAS